MYKDCSWNEMYDVYMMEIADLLKNQLDGLTRRLHLIAGAVPLTVFSVIESP